MERAFAALGVCADKVRRREPVRLRAIATQACRMAANGAEFLAEAEARTGISLRVISPREEAQLSVAGCSNLIDREADAALVLDVGGGSTELAWLDLRQRRGDARGAPPIAAWLSVPIGVVTLAERFPEGDGAGQGAADAWFAQMVEAVRAPIAAFAEAEPLRASVRRRAQPPDRHLGRDHQPGGPAPRPAALRPLQGRWPVDDALRVRGGAPAAGAAHHRRARPPALHRPGPRRPGAGRRGDPGGGAVGLALRAGAGGRPRPARRRADVADERAVAATERRRR